MRYIESVNTLYLAKILNYIVYEEIAIYINYILHDVCFPKNMGVMPRATLHAESHSSVVLLVQPGEPLPKHYGSPRKAWFPPQLNNVPLFGAEAHT